MFLDVDIPKPLLKSPERIRNFIPERKNVSFIKDAENWPLRRALHVGVAAAAILAAQLIMPADTSPSFAAAAPSPDQTVKITGASHRVFFPNVNLEYEPPVKSQKKGIAPNYPTWEDWRNTGSTWGYVYSTGNIGVWSPPPDSGIEIYPMVRVQSPDDPIYNKPSWVMGFNEPDIENEYTGATPRKAAEVWHDKIEPKTEGSKLVSPAPSHKNPGWLREFREEYIKLYGKPPRIDALATHCYLSPSECKTLVNQVIDWSNKWNIPNGVWLTEFAFEKQEDMVSFINWMESEPRISRYAWFTNRLRGDEDWAPDYKYTVTYWDKGTLTPYGRSYSQLPSKK